MDEGEEHHRSQRDFHKDKSRAFYPTPVVGFFRDNRRVEEKLPLVAPPSATSTSTCCFQSPTTRKRSGKELWSIVRNHVTHHSFHIKTEFKDTTRRVRDNVAFDPAKIDLPYDFSLQECFLALCVYLAISVVAFSFLFESWSVVDSMYFAVVTFTTIGYGDLTPTTTAGRLFGSIYALTGVAVLAIALGVVGSKLVETQVETIQAVEDVVAEEVLSIFQQKTTKDRQRDFLENSTAFSYLSDFDHPLHSVSEDAEDLIHPGRRLADFGKKTCALLRKYAPSLLPLVLGASMIGRYEGWSLDQVLYYCVVTTTTIGYGDLTPQRESLRLFAVVFIPLSVGAMGYFLGTMANFIMEQRMRVYDKKLWKHELTLEDLECMSSGCNGVVTELDFVIFMLRAMKKVDGELVDEIRKHFRKLDLTNSGTLVRADLEHMARRNLRSARSKLRLANYKSKLMRKGSYGSFDLA